MSCFVRTVISGEDYYLARALADNLVTSVPTSARRFHNPTTARIDARRFLNFARTVGLDVEVTIFEWATGLFVETVKEDV